MFRRKEVSSSSSSALSNTHAFHCVPPEKECESDENQMNRSPFSFVDDGKMLIAIYVVSTFFVRVQLCP